MSEQRTAVVHTLIRNNLSVSRSSGKPSVQVNVQGPGSGGNFCVVCGIHKKRGPETSFSLNFVCFFQIGICKRTPWSNHASEPRRCDECNPRDLPLWIHSDDQCKSWVRGYFLRCLWHSSKRGPRFFAYAKQTAICKRKPWSNYASGPRR